MVLVSNHFFNALKGSVWNSIYGNMQSFIFIDERGERNCLTLYEFYFVELQYNVNNNCSPNLTSG